MRRVWNGILKCIHGVWYGFPNKYIRGNINLDANGIVQMRKDCQEYKQEFEANLQDRNAKQWKKGQYHTYGLPIQETDIGEINFALLGWFAEKWLQDNSLEKRQFYLWLESNYFEHLLALEKNKKKYFKEAYRQFQYDTKSNLIQKAGRWIVRLLTLGVGAIVGAYADTIWTWIQTNAASVAAFPLWGKILVLLAALFFAAALWYLFHLNFNAEYVKKVAGTDKSRETWLRHSEAIMHYQNEILNYLWDTGVYRQYACRQDKDSLLLERILEFWRNNQQKFQHNMKDRGKSAKNGRMVNGADSVTK